MARNACEPNPTALLATHPAAAEIRAALPDDQVVAPRFVNLDYFINLVVTMKVTKQQLNDMSDREIGSLLHWLKFYTSQSASQLASVFVPEYCNSWNDIMPLAVEHKISIDWLANSVSALAYTEKSEKMNMHCKPQRAIACCLILVLQERE